MKHGTTTAEVKTGYGLETETELRQLEAILALDEQGPLEMIPTFLGAHAIPPEYKDDPEASPSWSAMKCCLLSAWWQEHAPKRTLPFVDVFCETGAFTLEQSRQILETAKRIGLPA